MGGLFNWGIIGPGQIARKFAEAVAVCKGVSIAAVASKSTDKAALFADEFGISTFYGTYEDLIGDPRIDAVYIANTHPFHHESILQCLENGMPVLCEKPLTLNEQQAEQVIGVARERGVFLMEALWTRFLPIYRQVDRWIADGRIGELAMITADFGLQAAWEDDDRHVDPRCGGGALLDLGVYNLALAVKYLGRNPVEIVSSMTRFRTGVDDKSTVVCRYESGALAVLSCALNVFMNDARILGSQGSIELPLHWRCSKATLTERSRPDAPLTETAEAGFAKGNGYQFEIRRVVDCIRAGLTECPEMPLDDTLAVSRIMTTLRREWGVVYPGYAGEER